MVSYVARSFDPSINAYLSQIAATNLQRLRAVEADARARADGAALKTANAAVSVADIAYAIGHDGRVYAVDPSSVPDSQKISIPGRPIAFKRPGQPGDFAIYPPATFLDFAAPRIEISPLQQAELFDAAGRERQAKHGEEQRLDEEFEPESLEASRAGENGFFPLAGGDFRTAVTSEPVRAAQLVASYARASNDLGGANQAARNKALNTVASFYAALANTQLAARPNLIDIAA